eukprot:scaffold5692_cov115-Pinguiococcus_pyrenoidosus.AAC.1
MRPSDQPNKQGSHRADSQSEDGETALEAIGASAVVLQDVRQVGVEDFATLKELFFAVALLKRLHVLVEGVVLRQLLPRWLHGSGALAKQRRSEENGVERPLWWRPKTRSAAGFCRCVAKQKSKDTTGEVSDSGRVSERRNRRNSENPHFAFETSSETLV